MTMNRLLEAQASAVLCKPLAETVIGRLRSKPTTMEEIETWPEYCINGDYQVTKVLWALSALGRVEYDGCTWHFPALISLPDLVTHASIKYYREYVYVYDTPIQYHCSK